MKSGDIFETSKYGPLEIIEYTNAKDVMVRFSNTGFCKRARADHIRNDLVKDSSCSRVCGVGIYDVYSKEERGRCYNVWVDIIRRCYEPECSSYHRYGGRGVIVDEKWKTYSNFKKWFDMNYLEGYELDKDLLIKKNLIYSEGTCVFVPKRINALLLLSDGNRGDLPIGVTYHSGNRKKRYQASMKKNNVGVSLGYYYTKEEAFKVYKKEKEIFVKQVAAEYFDRGEISELVYFSILEWEVED